MAIFKHILDLCTLDKLRFAYLSQFTQVDLHLQVLEVAMGQPFESSHRGEDLSILCVVYYHCLAIEKVQFLEFIAPQTAEGLQCSITNEVVIQLQYFQLRPMSLEQHLSTVIGQLIMRQE
jgi:hypothetical protein